MILLSLRFLPFPYFAIRTDTLTVHFPNFDVDSQGM